MLSVWCWLYAADVKKLDCDVGLIKLRVKYGDVCKERCEAIVNSTNSKLDLSVGTFGHSPLSDICLPGQVHAGRFRHHLRSASSTDYSLPRLRTKFGKRAFSHAGPAAWNALPEDIRANHDRAVFRKQLKTQFFTLAFNVR